jgi:hypothetical protein
VWLSVGLMELVGDTGRNSEPVAPNGLVGRRLVALRGVSTGDRSLAGRGTPSVTLEVRGPRPGVNGLRSARGERAGSMVKLDERWRGSSPRSTV